jgi:hypothetical protein
MCRGRQLCNANLQDVEVGMRISLRRIASIAVFVISMVFFVRVVLGVKFGSRRSLMRAFNKHVLNPLALWIVAHRRTYYGVLHHIGRRSGKRFATPVVAKLTAQGVIIPLPYGAETDWCRNVLAAGGCTLTLNGEDYGLNSPEVVPASVAEPLVPSKNAMIWRRVGIQSYLSLKIAEPRTSALGDLTTAGAIR